jgi:hypothetical protein
MKTVAQLLLPLLLLAANVRLYLKDGQHHLVREYRVLEDRVRFFSTERGEWEEVPLTLVDLKRTENEIKETAADEREKSQLIQEETQAEREAAREEALERTVDHGFRQQALLDGRDDRRSVGGHAVAVVSADEVHAALKPAVTPASGVGEK